MKPKHIAVIPDGNRRYARLKNLPASKGHEDGAERIKELIEHCIEYDISSLTIYALSTENYEKRPEEEVKFLLGLFERKLSRMLDRDEMSRKNVRINFIGRKDLLPEKLQKTMERLSSGTNKNTGLKVNIAVMYDGRKELADAARKCLDMGKELNEENMGKSLYFTEDIDLLIRTGQQRLSGFMLWQSSYAEIIFLPDVMWPEFNKGNFVSALEEFAIRKRNFGE